ncbi:cytochrome c oxidase assembly factor Coa1 family protein [Flavobacterium foetidum]|uniref:cytochrome c oxidase assembly factor Coa1 family protein n=1 Tax=Flavobacterium foetidum TaxID=2026681 RepID=UPI001074CD3D|nr:cytochrome c oxidase assembly factor Coa1 family protein [Flavobacterium foetidum]KAF2516431.1 hypothetical protein E0W73_04900 [Flavobacterium foetidum]
MQEDYQPKKSWWDRNWKWFVPTGCLSIIVLFVLFVGGIFFGVTSLMKESDAYKDAMAKAKINKEVIAQLGTPIEGDGMVSGKIQVNDHSGNCNIQIPIKGPKGTGIIFVTGTKRVKWKYSEMVVYIEKTDDEIDLLMK